VAINPRPAVGRPALGLACARAIRQTHARRSGGPSSFSREVGDLRLGRRIDVASTDRCGRQWRKNLYLLSCARHDIVTLALVGLWTQICDVIGAAHGSICSQCIAAALVLPSPLVAMATLGLARGDNFELTDERCVCCGLRRRGIRARRVVSATIALDPGERHGSGRDLGLGR
jgi:hypothetical protein